MNNNYCVYIHINKINNKKYVGQTHDLKKRWQNNGVGYKKCRYFNFAIEKYGWDNFEHIVLKDNLTKSEADYWEKYYIEFYQTKYNENGYNIREGGNGELSTETKEILSTKMKEKAQWAGEKNPRHNDPLYGERNGMYGKHHTEETKQKISEAKKGKEISEEQKEKIKNFMNTSHPRAKKVQCVETGEIFLSARKAAEKYGLGNSTISRICNGERKGSEKTKHWIWYEEE